MSSSVTGETSLGFFRLSSLAKPLKSKAENAISGRYGSMKKYIYLCGTHKLFAVKFYMKLKIMSVTFPC